MINMLVRKKKNYLFLAVLIFWIGFLGFSKPTYSSEVGPVVGSVAMSLFYTPLKGVVFIITSATGSLSFLFTAPAERTDISVRIMQWGFLGDWYIQPKHLQGKNKPNMIGTPTVRKPAKK